jgi:hypothetical protein
MTQRKARSSGKLADPDRGPTPSATETAGGVAAQPPQQFGSLSHWLIPSTIKLFNAAPESLDLAYSNAPPHPRVEASPALLDGFLRLESGTNEAILGYAQRWGPLWLCEKHDLPFRHEPECQTFREFEPVSEEELTRASQPEEQGKFHFATAWFQESLDGWRALSTQMRATLRIARRVHDGLAADDRDWDTLPLLRYVLVGLVTPGLEDPLASTEDYTNVDELEKRSGLKYEDLGEVVRSELKVDPPPGPRVHGDQHQVLFWETYYRLAEAIGRQQMHASIDFQRQVVAGVLNEWLIMAGVRPRLEWGTGNPQVQLGGDGLIGALAVQLFFACAQTGGVALCASCGTPFLPTGRRRRKDLNAYCSECGLKAALRDAAARYRQTQKYRATNVKWREQRSGRENV